jgi:hypothetical protein
MVGGRPRVLLAVCLAIRLAVPFAVASGERPARAEAPEVASASELSAARALFADALRDEEAKRFGDAIQKFRRVREVKDTAAVEYRLGACLEGLHEGPAAHAAYRRALNLGRADPRAAEIVEAARERLEALGKRVGLLTLSLPDGSPADAEVRVDGDLLAREDLGEAVAFAPGAHVVTATAKGAVPARSDVLLSEGARVSLTIELPLGRLSPPAPDEAPSAATPGHRDEDRDRPARRAGEVLGWVGIAGGGALLATSAVLLALRGADIASLHRDCPGDVCPPGSNRSELESTRDRALIEGPLGFAIGAAGLVTAGAAAYLLLSRRPSGSIPPSPARLAPWVSPRSGGIVAVGRFP